MRPTIESLQKEVFARDESIKTLREINKLNTEELRQLREETKNTIAQFGDLKERLLNSELLCAELRGYIKRTQESDVVLEPLVETRDEYGNITYSPKRTPTEFRIVQQTSNFGDYEAMASRGYREGELRRKPLNWVRYGMRNS